MKIIVAPDSFKGSLSAKAAAQAMATGWRRVFPDAQIVLLPVADGGEGTREALVVATEGGNISCVVTGPLGEKRDAFWGLLGDGETAVVELADAAALTMVPPEQRDPKITTTRGVGELLRNACQHPGVKQVILGLGGSATNDGGAGLLAALGVSLKDAEGKEIGDGGGALAQLASVSTENLAIDPRLVGMQVACDVDNPLTGPRGASAIFGPQKGATPGDITLLDKALGNFARVLGIDPNIPGSGAAGGTAAGLLYLFPQAQLTPGIDLVLDATRFDDHLPGATLVLTGEGRLDAQTLGGKVVAGVGRRAERQGVPAVAIVGGLLGDIDRESLARHTGVRAVLPAVPRPCTLEEAMQNAAAWVADAAERAAVLFALGIARRQI